MRKRVVLPTVLVSIVLLLFLFIPLHCNKTPSFFNWVESLTEASIEGASVSRFYGSSALRYSLNTQEQTNLIQLLKDIDQSCYVFEKLTVDVPEYSLAFTQEDELFVFQYSPACPNIIAVAFEAQSQYSNNKGTAIQNPTLIGLILNTLDNQEFSVNSEIVISQYKGGAKVDQSVFQDDKIKTTLLKQLAYAEKKQSILDIRNHDIESAEDFIKIAISSFGEKEYDYTFFLYNANDTWLLKLPSGALYTLDAAYTEQIIALINRSHNE